MEIFAVILFFSFTGFLTFMTLTLFSTLLEIVFEDYMFGDMCYKISKFCMLAMVVSGIIALISGFGTLFSYILSQSTEVIE